jgi:hypothetical protein
VQDDWQPRSNLTFNLGLRYDLQLGVFNEDIPELLSRIQDRLGRNGSYPLPIPFHEGSDRRGDKNNFGPRVGFAWDPNGTGNTNIHGGYGMFYENVRTLTNFGELTWPQSRSIIISRPSFPDALQGRSRDEFISTAPPNITVGDHDQVNAYAHQFNVGVSRMLTRDIAATADFTFVDRFSDRDTIDINLPDQVTRQRPYPQFNRVSYWQSSADNTYRALLVKVEKRMSRRYQFLVSYTLASAKDNGFTNNSPDVYGYTTVERYGSADRRHRMVTSGIFQVPGDILVSAILDLRSSLPFGPSTSFDLDSPGDGYTGDLPTGVAVGSGCRDLNLDAVNTFRASRNLAPISSVECPSFVNLDLRMSKSFTVGGVHRFEFIAQLFNVLNRGNKGTPTGNLTSNLFGQSTSISPNINAPSRQAEFAIRYQF